MTYFYSKQANSIMRVRVKGRFQSHKSASRLSNLHVWDKTDINITENTCELLNGRRIVEFPVLLENLRECKKCSNRLNVLDVVSETRQGLGSILGIICQNCGITCTVPTGKRHAANGGLNNPVRCFDVNTKLAAAMLNAGVGEMHVNNILSELNLPTVHHSTLKRREREIGRAFEEVADNSCDEAIQEELSFCEETPNRQTPVQVPSVSSDGGWQRRGTGLSHNSLSGHVTMVGRSTKKCVSFAVAKKSCRICKSAKSKGRRSRMHSCRRNWSGSAKGMEPHLTVTCLKKLMDSGFAVKKITMGDDTATYTKVKRFLLPDLIKCSDKNHVVKNMTNQLYRLKTKHKILSVSVINYLKKSFSYAVTQNSNNEEGVKKNISAIVPHAYGEHELCNPQWCRWHVKKDAYAHSSLPNGKDLQDDNLREDLSCLFSTYTTDVMAEKLSKVATSNSNENLNQLIAKKAPKSQHYSSSESLDFRVSAAVSQKNNGHKYVLKVNKKCGLSPGKFTEKRALALDFQRDRNAKRHASIDGKRRRLKLKEERLSNEAVNEVHEGITYQTGIEANETVTDLEIIPEPLLLEQRPSDQCDTVKDSIIVFDLETTGLAHDTNIIQIAAKHLTSGDEFSSYILPKSGYIPAAVSKLTGIELHGNVLFHHHLPVTAKRLNRALESFQLWLEKYNNPVLVAHNVHFDSKVLVYSYQSQTDMPFPDVGGFADSLKLFRATYPGLQNHKQEYLVQQLLKKNYTAHDAVSDVSTLVELLSNIQDVETKLQVFSATEVAVKLQRLSNEKQNLSSYSQLIEKKVISKCCSKNLAGSGLNAQHIKQTHDRHGIDGLSSLLRQRIKNFRKVGDSLHTFYEHTLPTSI